MHPGIRRSAATRVLSELLRLIFPALLVILPARVALSQTELLRDGMRVRVGTPSARKIVGVVKSHTIDSVYLYTGEAGATLGLARSDVTTVRVSQGRTSAHGAKRGALWGLAVAAVVVAVTSPVAMMADEAGYSEESFGAFALQMIGAGALWGAGIGALVKSEKWDRAPVKARIQSSSSGIGLGFSVKPAFLH